MSSSLTVPTGRWRSCCRSALSLLCVGLCAWRGHEVGGVTFSIGLQDVDTPVPKLKTPHGIICGYHEGVVGSAVCVSYPNLRTCNSVPVWCGPVGCCCMRVAHIGHMVMLADLRTEAQVLSIATRKIVFPAPYKRNLL